MVCLMDNNGKNIAVGNVLNIDPNANFHKAIIGCGNILISLYVSLDNNYKLLFPNDGVDTVVEAINSVVVWLIMLVDKVCMLYILL